MNTMIRFYSGATDAEKKQAMAFDLSPFDLKLLKFGELFRRRFMDIHVSLPLLDALELGWRDAGRVLRAERTADEAGVDRQVLSEAGGNSCESGARVVRLSLNKTALKQQRDQLGTYRRFLPSLDLKRQQLLGAWKEARLELEAVQERQAKLRQSLDRLLPLLGSSTLPTHDLASLIQVRNVVLGEENVVGARVPVLKEIAFERAEYSTLTLPFWVDLLVESLEQEATIRVELQVHEERVERLGAAARKITQRVNLFEKVLIPTAVENIRKIRIALSDEERSAVVRSKLAKRKQQPVL